MRKTKKGYLAELKHKGKVLRLGYFPTKEKASREQTLCHKEINHIQLFNGLTKGMPIRVYHRLELGVKDYGGRQVMGRAVMDDCLTFDKFVWGNYKNQKPRIEVVLCKGRMGDWGFDRGQWWFEWGDKV